MKALSLSRHRKQRSPQRRERRESVQTVKEAEEGGVGDKRYAQQERIFTLLRKDKANKHCFDCYAPNARWASVNNAIFLCMNCTSLHRSLGVNFSFVQSTTIDLWSGETLRMMSLGGNKRLKEWFKEYGLFDKSMDLRYMTIAA